MSTIPAPRSLEQALADCKAKLKALPFNDRRRGILTRQIVGLEDEIERKRSAE